jgi:hypothetical protein
MRILQTISFKLLATMALIVIISIAPLSWLLLHLQENLADAAVEREAKAQHAGLLVTISSEAQKLLLLARFTASIPGVADSFAADDRPG